MGRLGYRSSRRGAHALTRLPRPSRLSPLGAQASGHPRGDAQAPGAVTQARPLLPSRGRRGRRGRGSWGKGSPQDQPCAIRVACTHQ